MKMISDQPFEIAQGELAKYLQEVERLCTCLRSEDVVSQDDIQSAKAEIGRIQNLKWCCLLLDHLEAAQGEISVLKNQIHEMQTSLERMVPASDFDLANNQIDTLQLMIRSMVPQNLYNEVVAQLKSVEIEYEFMLQRSRDDAIRYRKQADHLQEVTKKMVPAAELYEARLEIKHWQQIISAMKWKHQSEVQKMQNMISRRENSHELVDTGIQCNSGCEHSEFYASMPEDTLEPYFQTPIAERRFLPYRGPISPKLSSSSPLQELHTAVNPPACMPSSADTSRLRHSSQAVGPNSSCHGHIQSNQGSENDGNLRESVDRSGIHSSVTISDNQRLSIELSPQHNILSSAFELPGCVSIPDTSQASVPPNSPTQSPDETRATELQDLEGCKDGHFESMFVRKSSSENAAVKDLRNHKTEIQDANFMRNLHFTPVYPTLNEPATFLGQMKANDGTTTTPKASHQGFDDTENLLSQLLASPEQKTYSGRTLYSSHHRNGLEIGLPFDQAEMDTFKPPKPREQEQEPKRLGLNVITTGAGAAEAAVVEKLDESGRENFLLQMRLKQALSREERLREGINVLLDTAPSAPAKPTVPEYLGQRKDPVARTASPTSALSSSTDTRIRDGDASLGEGDAQPNLSPPGFPPACPKPTMTPHSPSLGRPPLSPRRQDFAHITAPPQQQSPFTPPHENGHTARGEKYDPSAGFARAAEAFSLSSPKTAWRRTPTPTDVTSGGGRSSPNDGAGRGEGTVPRSRYLELERLFQQVVDAARRQCISPPAGIVSARSQTATSTGQSSDMAVSTVCATAASPFGYGGSAESIATGPTGSPESLFTEVHVAVDAAKDRSKAGGLAALYRGAAAEIDEPAVLRQEVSQLRACLAEIASHYVYQQY